MEGFLQGEATGRLGLADVRTQGEVEADHA